MPRETAQSRNGGITRNGTTGGTEGIERGGGNGQGTAKVESDRDEEANGDGKRKGNR